MNIYISGPISGHPRTQTSHVFGEAERLIAEAGHTPVSPLDNGLPPHSTYEQHLAADFAMLLGCDAILLLYGWQGSRGCRMEYSIASNMGKTIFTSFAGLSHVRRTPAGVDD